MVTTPLLSSCLIAVQRGTRLSKARCSRRDLHSNTHGTLFKRNATLFDSKRQRGGRKWSHYTHLNKGTTTGILSPCQHSITVCCFCSVKRCRADVRYASQQLYSLPLGFVLLFSSAQQQQSCAAGEAAATTLTSRSRSCVEILSLLCLKPR